MDERLPLDQRKEFTPTPKQMLYGNRAELVSIVPTEKEEIGRIKAGYAEVELKESFGGDWSRCFVFPALNRPLEDGKLYTLDPCPNDWYGYWSSQVVEGLCDGQPNTLYDRLVHPPPAGAGSGSPGQLKFLAGLDAFHQAGHLHAFEVGKRSFIGGHGSTPVLLVHGPPGTGKSYSTAFAVLARLQGAMQAKHPFRCSCLARPTPPPTCCSRMFWKCRRNYGHSGTPTRTCSASISTPDCSMPLGCHKVPLKWHPL